MNSIAVWKYKSQLYYWTRYVTSVLLQCVQLVCIEGHNHTVVIAWSVIDLHGKTINLGIWPLVLALSLYTGADLQIFWLHHPTKLGVSKDVASWLSWNQSNPKHTQTGTQTSAFPTVWPTTIQMLELSSYIAKDLNLKNDFRLKILVRFTTENCSVSSKQNAYGFKYNFFCFLMKELASFCEAKKKKSWCLLHQCNHKMKK